jgi:hypothetical protein
VIDRHENNQEFLTSLPEEIKAIKEELKTNLSKSNITIQWQYTSINSTYLAEDYVDLDMGPYEDPISLKFPKTPL